MRNYKNKGKKQKPVKKIVFIIFIALVAAFVLITSCDRDDSTDNAIITSDNIELGYTFTESNSDKAVLLLHMLGKDKESYTALTQYLTQHSYTVLAIDFRGHGESELEDETFTENDWKNLVLDVEAGVDFLEMQGYERIAVIGASIGANAALKHAVQDTRIDTLILLSAGEEYHGINTLDIAGFYDRPVLFLASYADKDAAVAATKLFNAVNTEEKNIKFYEQGHGTELFELYKEIVAEEVLFWLEGYY
jgi:esterase/lipase